MTTTTDVVVVLVVLVLVVLVLVVVVLLLVAATVVVIVVDFRLILFVFVVAVAVLVVVFAAVVSLRCCYLLLSPVRFCSVVDVDIKTFSRYCGTCISNGTSVLLIYNCHRCSHCRRRQVIYHRHYIMALIINISICNDP